MASAMSATILDSCDVIDFVVNQGNGVKALAEMSLKSVPKQYIQPLEERMDMSIVSEESLPIIDVSNWDDPKVAKSICEAANKWGFFQIINHGVPIDVLENVKDATHLFFELPTEERRKYLKEHSPTENACLRTSFMAQAETVLEWKDYFSLLYVSEDDASAFWPPVCRLLQVLMKRLNVKEIETKESLLMGSIRINLNYYPICPNSELTAGLGRHSDTSTLTVLLQDGIGGLYVRGISDDHRWIHVPPLSGSLVL